VDEEPLLQETELYTTTIEGRPSPTNAALLLITHLPESNIFGIIAGADWIKEQAGGNRRKNGQKEFFKIRRRRDDLFRCPKSTGFGILPESFQ
jgi:hypothetical protein